MTTMNLARSRTALRAALIVCSTLAFIHAAAQPAAAQGKPIEFIIHPLLVQAPLFGASIDLPRLPSAPPISGGGDDGSDVSGSTDVKLNSIYMAGLEVQAERWFGEFNFTLADVSASRNAPRVSLDSDAKLFNARGGVRVGDGLAATVGVRYIGVDLDAVLTLPAIGKTLEGKTKPTLWDPLIGADWRRKLGNHWTVDANFQGGGFGVGADVDVSGEVYADWRIAGPFQIRLGYKALYYKLTVADVSIGSFSRTLVTSQTLHGPVLGLGFTF
jgi:hypothetical protein